MPTTIKLDAMDRRILDALQEDSRLTNLELADRVGLSPSPCLRRVRRLETEKVIERYGVRLNRRLLGLGITAFVAVGIEGHTAEAAARLRKTLLAMPEVIGCYITSGDHDILLHVVVPDLDEYSKFTLERLLRVSGVKDVRSSFVMETIKENASLPLQHLA